MLRERVLHSLHRALRLRWRATRPITVGVRVLLVREAEVLLVRHSYQPGWFMPGGAVDRGETLAEAARREAAEEVGADIAALELFGVYTSFVEHKSDHVAVFAAAQFEMREPPRSLEIAERVWFPLAALPPDISPGTARRIAELQSGEAVTGRHGRW